MKTKLLCFGLILVMVFSMASCEKANDTTTEPTGDMTTTSNTAPDTEPTTLNANSTLLPDLDEENERLLRELKSKDCLFGFEKKLYPAEKILDMVELDLPEKINDHYWYAWDIVDDENLIIELMERDPRYDSLVTMYTEYGIYNLVKDEYKTIYKFDTTKDVYAKGITPLNNKEFVVIFSSYESAAVGRVSYYYVNTDTDELRLLTELSYDEYSYLSTRNVIGRDLYYNRIIPSTDSYALMKLNIDSGEEEQIDNYGVMPYAYNGSVAYVSMDTKKHTATIKGTDFSKTWIQNDDKIEALSSPIGAFAAHQNSEDIFILTKTRDTDELLENVKAVSEGASLYDYALYTLKKHNADNPEGELIIKGRGSLDGVLFFIRDLKYNGRFVSWYTGGSDVVLIYDNKLDVLLYFSDIDIGSLKVNSPHLSKSDSSGYIVTKLDYNYDENATWEENVNVKKHIIFFKVKDEYN